MSFARTGHHAYLQYGKETNFKTFPAMTRAWGFRQQASGIEYTNTLLKLNSIGSPVYEKYVFANFQGSYTIEHVLSNPWWLDLLYDVPNSQAGTPNVHTYPNQTTYPNTVPKEIFTFGTEIGISQPSPANMVLQYAGNVIQNTVISGKINDWINVKHSILYAKTPVIATSLDSTLPTDDINFPYTYIHGTLTLAGLAVGTIQSIELTQDQTGNLLWGFGSAEAEDKYRGMMEVKGKVHLAFKNKELLQLALDKTEPTNNTMQMVFTNGGSGASEKSLTFDGTGIGFPSHSIPSVVAGEVIFQDVPFEVRIPKWTARNAIASPPA